MKTKIKVILGVIVFTIFIGQISLFNILYPAIGDPDFWNKSHQAMVELDYIRLISTFLIASYLGWIFYDMYQMMRK